MMSLLYFKTLLSLFARWLLFLEQQDEIPDITITDSEKVAQDLTGPYSVILWCIQMSIQGRATDTPTKPGMWTLLTQCSATINVIGCQWTDVLLFAKWIQPKLNARLLAPPSTLSDKTKYWLVIIRGAFWYAVVIVIYITLLGFPFIHADLWTWLYLISIALISNWIFDMLEKLCTS